VGKFGVLISEQSDVVIDWKQSWEENIWTVNCLENEGVSRNFRTGRLERELLMVQLSATRCSAVVSLFCESV